MEKVVIYHIGTRSSGAITGLLLDLHKDLSNNKHCTVMTSNIEDFVTKFEKYTKNKLFIKSITEHEHEVSLSEIV